MVTKTSATPSISAASRNRPPGTTGCTPPILGRVDRREQRAERQQDRAVPRLALPRRRQGDDTRPAAGIVMLARQPAAQRQHRLRHLVMGSAAAVPLDQRRRGLAEGAGVDLQRQALDPPVCVELDGEHDPAATGRRMKLRAAILSLERIWLLERGREAEDLGRVEWLRHCAVYSRRHVVPEEPSSKIMPSALSSSRMRSAVAKSRFFFASARSAMRVSTSAASALPWNQSADEFSSKPRSCALALSSPPSSADSRESASG